MSEFFQNNSARIQRDAADWLGQKFKFSHFVTLAANDPMAGRKRMRRLVKNWDAHMNRHLYGPKWLKRYDELLFWFAFLEKPEANPHWHLLIEIPFADETTRNSLGAKIFEYAEPEWKRLISSGTVRTRAIYNRINIAEYVAKELGHELQYTELITPDEFRPPRQS